MSDLHTPTDGQLIIHKKVSWGKKERCFQQMGWAQLAFYMQKSKIGLFYDTGYGIQDFMLAK